jgi:hypothetical protein
MALAQTAGSQDLPEDARAVLGEYHKGVAGIRRKADAETATLQRKADAETATLQRKYVPQLKALQDKYCRAAKLDEALAVRGVIRQVLGIQPDPGLVPATADDIGRTLLFIVAGSLEGSVWGTETYTSDSKLSAAAVHAGVLRPGERGVVRVRIVPGLAQYMGSTSHGVTSQSYGAWEASFTVEAAREIHEP